jgi:hypothetical protein
MSIPPKMHASRSKSLLHTEARLSYGFGKANLERVASHVYLRTSGRLWDFHMQRDVPPSGLPVRRLGKLAQSSEPNR